MAELEFEPIVFEKTLVAAPEMTVTGIDRDYQNGVFRLIYWASGGDFEAFEAALANDPGIEDYRTLSELEDRRLQRVAYRVAPEDSLYRIAVKHDIQMIESELTADRSILRSRYPTRSDLTAVLDAFEEQDIQVSVRRLYTDVAEESDTVLTDRQREVITYAYREGYFNVPHGISLESIGEAMDISRQAVSKHLWRGLGKLIAREFSEEV